MGWIWNAQTRAIEYWDVDENSQPYLKGAISEAYLTDPMVRDFIKWTWGIDAVKVVLDSLPHFRGIRWEAKYEKGL